MACAIREASGWPLDVRIFLKMIQTVLNIHKEKKRLTSLALVSSWYATRFSGIYSRFTIVSGLAPPTTPSPTTFWRLRTLAARDSKGNPIERLHKYPISPKDSEWRDRREGPRRGKTAVKSVLLMTGTAKTARTTVEKWKLNGRERGKRRAICNRERTFFCSRSSSFRP